MLQRLEAFEQEMAQRRLQNAHDEAEKQRIMGEIGELRKLCLQGGQSLEQFRQDIAQGRVIAEQVVRQQQELAQQSQRVMILEQRHIPDAMPQINEIRDKVQHHTADVTRIYTTLEDHEKRLQGHRERINGHRERLDTYKEILQELVKKNAQ